MTISVLIKFSVLLVSIFYFMLEGKREAIYYHFKNRITGTNLKEHTLFTLQRSLYFLICLLVFSLMFSGWFSFLYIFSLMLIFPYFHDGMYYLIRNKMDISIYRKRWKDDSNTSTAKFEIKYNLRLWMFLIGLLNYLILILIQCVDF